jgi:hypothetical protein
VNILGIVMKVLPADKRALLELAMRITSSIDTPEERKAVAKFGMEILADGKVTGPEWLKLGKALGVMRGKH